MLIDRTIIWSVIIVSSIISTASATAGTCAFYTPPYVPSSCYGSEDQGKMIAAAGPDLFNNRAGCGQFYRVVCTGGTNTSVGPACRDGVVRVKIVDLCPGCGAQQIDLSGEAFSLIANPNAGKIRIDNEFYVIPCNGTLCELASAPEQDKFIYPPVKTAPTPKHSQTGDGMPPVQTAPSSNDRQIGEGSNSRRSPPKKVVIDRLPVVLLCITGVVIASIIMFCLIKRRYSKGHTNRESNQYVEKFLVQHGSLAPKRYKYSEIKKITKSFSDKLGKGGYGSVYKGILPDGSVVAVKVLMETESNGEDFINEVASISRTSHVNIVALLGFCYERSKRALIFEYMPNKSLDKFLSNKAETDCLLDLQKLFKISVGIAKGLEYLHSGCSTRIVHFDIKPQNILLDEDLCPKISDFGLAKLCKKKQSVLSVLGTRGTIGYIAPEVFSRNFGGVSHKSDVYSYGMMVLEMVGAKNVVETHEVAPSSECYFPDKIYEQVILDVTNKVDDLMIEEEEEETRRKMFLIGFWCIQTIPSDRPSMSKVGEMLEGSLQSIQIPPKPFLFTPNLPAQQFSSTFSAHVDTENSSQDLDIIVECNQP